MVALDLLEVLSLVTFYLPSVRPSLDTDLCDAMPIRIDDHCSFAIDDRLYLFGAAVK